MNGHRVDEAPFDHSAAGYDSAFDGLPGVPRLRARLHKQYIGCFPKGGTVLDIGCGTGTDAIALTRAGFAVCAIDPSPAMIETARRKIPPDLVGKGAPDFRILRAEDLRTLLPMRFDGGYSDFGALNCVADLKPFFQDTSELLNPGAPLILTVMPPVCLWESASYLLRGQPRKALRRSAGSAVPVRLKGGEVPVFYHSLRSIRSVSARHFVVEDVAGLNILTPPPGHLRAYRSFRKLVPVMEWLDDRIESVPGLRAIGDHLVVTLRKRVRPSGAE